MSRTTHGVIYLKDLFVQVALVQLETRKAGVLTGTASGNTKVSQDFLNDVATITTAIVQAAEQYSESELPTQKQPEPQYLAEARANFQDALDSVVEENRQLLVELED